MQAFAEASFAARVEDLLRAFPGEADDAPPAAEIAEQVERARRHGFREERDCALWVLCAWCLGRDFDRKIASIAELLGRKEFGPEYKALALEVMLHGVFFSLAGRSRSMP